MYYQCHINYEQVLTPIQVKWTLQARKVIQRSEGELGNKMSRIAFSLYNYYNAKAKSSEDPESKIIAMIYLKKACNYSIKLLKKEFLVDLIHELSLSVEKEEMEKHIEFYQEEGELFLHALLSRVYCNKTVENFDKIFAEGMQTESFQEKKGILQRSFLLRELLALLKMPEEYVDASMDFIYFEFKKSQVISIVSESVQSKSNSHSLAEIEGEV